MMKSYLLISVIAALAGPAYAQTPANDGARPGNDIGTGMSLPRSDRASNLDAATTHSEIAPNLPAPVGGETIQSLLLIARQDLRQNQSGAAQEALERAQTRALDRAVPYNGARVPAADPLSTGIARARAALAAGDTAAAIRLIDGLR